MEIILGLLILGIVLFVIVNKKKTTPIVEEVKDELKKVEETAVVVEAKLEEVLTAEIKKATARVKKTTAKVAKPKKTKV